MTHQMWMDDPLRIKNCHFLETTYDNGITINPDKNFDTEAEWNYLKGRLSDKVGEETAEKKNLARKKYMNHFDI
jgi:hypothetical protein